MTRRPDLTLSASEQRAFLDDVLGRGSFVACATPGADGYPVVALVEATHRDDAIAFVGETPIDGEVVCCIVERGDTYDDIAAVVARGVVRDRSLPLTDVVSFEFAKLGRSV